MVDALEGNYELDDIDDDDLRSPLILEASHRFNTSKASAFFQFPVVSPRRSILKPRKPRSSPKQSIFLTVPGGHTASLPSPIPPCSTPLSVHKVSFYGKQDSLPAEQSMTCPPTQFDTTKYKRSQYLSNLLLVLTDGLLPLVSIVSTLINVLELFLTGETILGCAGLVIFAFPTVLVLFYYLENMFHREKKLLEMGLIMVFGPFLRWLCSVRLLSLKLRPSGEVADLDDIQRFAFATKVIDGIFEASVQIIWLLYLIAIEVYPFPLLNMRTKSVTDCFGNNLQIPVFSSLSLYSSLAVLVKNLSQLWRIHYPQSTTQNGSETLQLQPKMEGSLKTLYQWLILLLFTSTGILYRLISYTLLFLHLNLFMMPAGGIMICSTILHVVLRGVSNRFYVETSKMNVFLTACCCCLVPTPTSSNIRAHNLLQAHTAITNILLLISVCVSIFLSIDYSVPIVRRPSRLVYSSTYFYNYCLVAVSLLPISTLFYLLYKKTMGYPGLVRRTIFWKNNSPTIAAILTGIVSVFLLGSVVLLNMMGRHSSYQCQESTSPIHHGLLVSQDTGHGSKLECHQNYRPHPAPSIYCSWFFGPQGVMEIVPLYYQALTDVQSYSGSLVSKGQYVSERVAFVRNLTTVACLKKNMTSPSCSQSTPCQVTDLLTTAVPHGSWQCSGHTCALFCQPGYLSTGNGNSFPCAVETVPAHYCHLASLAVSNKTSTQTVSPDGDCSSSWKLKTGHVEPNTSDHLILCRNASDALVPNNSCQALDLTDHHLSFIDASQDILSMLHVSYPPLSLSWLEKGGKALSEAHFTIDLEKECIVKISHDTMLVVGEMTLLLRYAGPGIIYWVLPSLQFPRHYHACTLLGGGRVLVTGGVGVWRGDWLVKSEMMNLDIGVMDQFSGLSSFRIHVPEWTQVGSLAVPRMGGRILTVSGGCPLLVGGHGEQEGEDLSVEEFHLHTGKDEGDWLEVSLDISLRPETWSVALCGVDSCTQESFVDGKGLDRDTEKGEFNEKLIAEASSQLTDIGVTQSKYTEDEQSSEKLVTVDRENVTEDSSQYTDISVFIENSTQAGISVFIENSTQAGITVFIEKELFVNKEENSTQVGIIVFIEKEQFVNKEENLTQAKVTEDTTVEMIFSVKEQQPSATEATTERMALVVAEPEPATILWIPQQSSNPSLTAFSFTTSSVTDLTDSSLAAVATTSTKSASETALTEVFTFYPVLLTTESPVLLSTQPTDLTTDLIVFTFDPEDATSESFAKEMDEDDENQSTTVTVNVDEIDLTIFDLPSNYQDN